jgi:hypothetical protein
MEEKKLSDKEKTERLLRVEGLIQNVLDMGDELETNEENKLFFFFLADMAFKVIRERSGQKSVEHHMELIKKGLTFTALSKEYKQ